ncbi:flagellar basal-body MS-ring/collar protein FliF [Calditerricola satsumensis]|nr:flagellar basal-body MS-ring/collar protein FliF [Calditerricola satsumensis]
MSTDQYARMRERIERIRRQGIALWQRLSRKQKVLLGATVFFVVASAAMSVALVAQPEYVPLYTENLSQEELGQIKAQLEKMGVPYRITAGGHSIEVPRTERDRVLLDLAAQGLPHSASIRYDTFLDKLPFGVTDRQFDVLERDAIQGEIESLLENGVDWIQKARVMITLPKERMWVGEEQQEASASVVLTIEPGYQPSPDRVRALYHLVSRSVPNLPVENIVITDQYGRLLEYPNAPDADSATAALDQEKIRQQIEKHLQSKLQSLLGTVFGHDRVVVSVVAKVNFDRVQETRQLVEPPAGRDEGLVVSEEHVAESASGEGAVPGGIAGTGSTDIPSYPGVTGSGNQSYERTEDRVNREFNRIKQEIARSPYAIEDVAISVGIEPPDPANPNSLSPETQQQVRDMLRGVVRAVLGGTEGRQLTDAEIDSRITVMPSPLQGKVTAEEESGWRDVLWYGLGAAAVAAAGAATYTIVRRRRNAPAPDVPVDLPVVRDLPADQEPQPEENAPFHRVEQLARERPEEFVKLLRAWLSEE